MNNIIFTRPTVQSDTYIEELGKVSIAAKNIPLIEIVKDNTALAKLKSICGSKLKVENKKIDWVIFTSKNSVDLTFDEVGSELISIAPKIISVGPATSEAVRKRGGKVYYECVGQNSLSLISELDAIGNFANQLVLLPTSKQAKDNLEEALSLRQTEILRVDIYEPQSRHITKEELAEIISARLLCFFSPSAVRSAFNQADERNDCRIVTVPALAIGPTTFAELKKYGFETLYVTPTTSPDSVVDTVKNLIGKNEI